MEAVERDEEFIVVDERIKPFTAIPRTGVVAIREGRLDTKELSVYFVMNMMLDGMIKVSKDVDYPKAIAKFTGLTERQVTNAYKKLDEKGLLTIEGDNVRVNE
jgi:DNA-binding MarR family transcriptional regulator